MQNAKIYLLHWRGCLGMVENSRGVPNLSDIYPPNIYKGHLISSAGFVFPGFQLPCQSCSPVSLRWSHLSVGFSLGSVAFGLFFFLQDSNVIIREGNGTPLQHFCLENPWTEEPGRLQSMGSLKIRHDWTTSLSLFTFMHWRRKWQLTPVFLPGESQGRGSLVGCRVWGRTE